MFPLPSDDMIPEQDKLLTEIINGCTVIKQNHPAQIVFELICERKKILKKQIAEELQMDIGMVREIVRILAANDLVSVFSKPGWAEIDYFELSQRDAQPASKRIQ